MYDSVLFLEKSDKLKSCKFYFMKYNKSDGPYKQMIP